MINQWEIISPLVDKINSIGTELEEIIVELLIPKFNQIEKESDKNEVNKNITVPEFSPFDLIRPLSRRNRPSSPRIFTYLAYDLAGKFCQTPRRIRRFEIRFEDRFR